VHLGALRAPVAIAAFQQGKLPRPLIPIDDAPSRLRQGGVFYVKSRQDNAESLIVTVLKTPLSDVLSDCGAVVVVNVGDALGAVWRIEEDARDAALAHRQCASCLA